MSFSYSQNLAFELSKQFEMNREKDRNVCTEFWVLFHFQIIWDTIIFERVMILLKY